MPVKVVARLRIIPHDRPIYEAVQIGQVEARDAFTDLVMEATIAIDREELARIAKIPEVADAMSKVTPPEVRQYGTTERSAGDWRAKVPEIRKAQWIQRPVIDYVVESNKEAVLEAVMNKFDAMPPEWRSALFGPGRENMTYAKDPKALQLSMLSGSDIKTASKAGKDLWPEPTTKWKYVYVNVVIKLGDADSGTGFIGQVASEAKQTAGNVVKAGEGQMQWPSSLTGLDTVLRGLDPYAGTKMSSTVVPGTSWLVADEPGYDIAVREGILDRITDALASAFEMDVSGVEVDDNGVFTFAATRPPTEEPSEQDEIAAQMEPEAPEADFEGPEEAPEADADFGGGGGGEAPEFRD